MGKIIKHILQYDPDYNDKLNDLLSNISPLFHKAENLLLSNLLSESGFSELSYEQCLRIIFTAIEKVPDYEVSIYDTESDSEDPIRILRWDRTDIIRDRFGYLFKMTDRKTNT